MLTLTLRPGDTVLIGGDQGTTLRLGDEEVTVKFLRIIREDRVQISFDAPGRAIQRAQNVT